MGNVIRIHHFDGPARRATAMQALAAQPPLPVYASHLDEWPEATFTIGRGSMSASPNYFDRPPRTSLWALGLTLLLGSPAIAAAFSIFLSR